MITIHHEKETDFSKNGYGAIDDYVMSQEVTWEMNGQFYAYLEYPAFLDKSAYLVNKNILRVPVPFMEDQLFRIYRVRKVLGFIQVEARHIFYDLMDNLIEDTNIVGKTGSQAIQQLLGATQYEHRFIGLSDISTSNNARMVRYNPVEALLDDSKANTFVSRWGGEIVRDNFLIRMARQMGTDRGVRIQHRKDLTAYIATIDESTVVTRIMPVGFDGLKLPELYIDSPLLDPDNPKIGVIRYENVKAAIGEYADDNGAVPLEEAYELLREHARAEFNTNHLDEPEMTVTVNFVTLHNTKEYAGFAQLQEIHQGDVVRVSVPEEGFEITSRLVAFTSDPLQQNHYTSTTLGNHVYEFTSSTNSVSTLRNEVEALRESVVEVRQSANGKNQSFWGEADPNTLNLNAILGDTYFRSVGEEDVIYQYVEVDGERYWKEIINTANTSEVKKEVERVAEEAEKLADDITEAQQSADDAKRDAGLALTASEALELITQETANKMVTVEQIVADAKTDASNALTQAGSAVTQSGQAVANAQTAMDNAQTALSKASDTESTVTTLSTDIDTIAGKVALKAEQTEVDTVKGTVSTHTTTLSQHATAIASKAEKSVVDTISGTVSTHSTTLTQHATALSSKAEQTEVDTVTGLVSTNTSTLEQQAKDISARLTQSQVNSLVSDKGYSTVSYVDTKMSATAEGIRNEITAVEGKIPQSYTEDNLVVNSKEYVRNNDYMIKEYNLTKQLTMHKEYTIVLEGGIGATGSDQEFAIFFDGGGSHQGNLENMGGGIFKKTFTLEQTGAYTPDKSYFRLYNRPNNGSAATIKWIKLVEGKAKDNLYKPSMNDLLMENDFTAFKTDFDIKAKGWDVTSSYVSNNQIKINSLISNADGWQNTISYVDTNKTKINQTISRVDSYVQTIGTNGEKIASLVMTDSAYQTSIRKGRRNLLKDSYGRIANGDRFHSSFDVKDPIPHGTKVTLSFKASSGGSQIVQIYNTNSYYKYGDVKFTMGTTPHVYHLTFTTYTHSNGGPTIDINDQKIKFYNKLEPSPSAWIILHWAVLQYGEIGTEHYISDDEDFETQVSEIKQTADAVQLLVGTTKESVARAVMTSSLWETEVSKVIDDELEQEYKTVTSKVNVVNGVEGINNGEGTGEGRYFYFNNSDGVVEGTLSRNATYTLEFSTQSSDNKGNAITLQVKPYGTTEWQPIVTGQMTSGKQISTFTFENNVFASSVSDYRLLIRSANGENVPYIWGFKLYKEVEVEVPIEGTNTGVISSKITQLYNMINLSILGKDGALSRIAIGEDGIQIDGKLLHITAKTFIDNAVIKSAMIDTLDAGKITTGELNASLIRVVNLDASSITGNEASFIKAMFSGTKSSLQITSNGVNILDNYGRSSTYLDSSGIGFFRQGVNLGKLEYVTNISDSGDLNNMHGFSMRPNRNSYFGVSYFPSTTATQSIRSFAVSGRTGNVYMDNIHPDETSDLGIKFSVGVIDGTSVVYITNKSGRAGVAFGQDNRFFIINNNVWQDSRHWKN